VFINQFQAIITKRVCFQMVVENLKWRVRRAKYWLRSIAAVRDQKKTGIARPNCPLCGSILEITENKLGVHSEGVLCYRCGCNARNRFFYAVLNDIIEELSCTSHGSRELQMLEASSYGYAMMGARYVDRMKDKGVHVLCADYNESNYKSVVKEDISALSFEDNSFDIMCHSHVLEHVQDDLRALKEGMRCLKPGGVMLIGVPIQTDFTFMPEGEYHGDNAYVYRRNGWDLIGKIKEMGFYVEVRVPPEHVSLSPDSVVAPDSLVLDDIRFVDKFGPNYFRYRDLFHPAFTKSESQEQWFDKLWAQLELFVVRKPCL